MIRELYNFYFIYFRRINELTKASVFSDRYNYWQIFGFEEILFVLYSKSDVKFFRDILKL